MDISMDVKIPKIIHQIWIGDPNDRPIEMMDKVKNLHPDWEYKLWTEDELIGHVISQEKFDLIVDCSKTPDFYPKIADICRYLILEEYGGFYIDADTDFIRPLDVLSNREFVACYEIDGLMISNGVIGTIPHHPIISHCLSTIAGLIKLDIDTLLNKKAWKVTGPRLLTFAVNFIRSEYAVILPHFAFLPIHHSDYETDEEYDALYDKIGKASFCTTKWGHKSMYKVKPNRDRFKKYLRGEMILSQ